MSDAKNARPRRRVPWALVWEEFDAYCDRYAPYNWDRQRRKIEKLVERALRGAEVQP